MDIKNQDIDEMQPDYLAEIYRIWNCDRCRWALMSPLLFRLESDDYLVWSEDDEMLSTKGAIDTQHFSDDYTRFCEQDQAESNTQDAYCWLRDIDTKHECGSIANAAQIAEIARRYFED